MAGKRGACQRVADTGRLWYTGQRQTQTASEGYPAQSPTGGRGQGTMPHVFNELAQLVGRVEQDGGVYTMQGRSVGAVQPGGSVYDATGQLVGGVSASGLIYDRQGTQVGEVHLDGGI